MKHVLLSLLFLATAIHSANAKDDTSSAEVVKQHLASLGSEEARAAVKSRVVEGTLQFQMQHQGGLVEGKEMFVSDGKKLVSLLKLPNPTYHGERFVSDGSRTSVAYMKPGAYSEFGQFMNSHNEVIRDGLWGGTLSTGWFLLDLPARGAKLQSMGRKKIDGKELEHFRYQPAKHSDLDIQLYFEPETGRHVMTTYDLTIGAQMAVTEEETAKQKSTFYRLEERFADYKQHDGIWLPDKWAVQFTADIPIDPSHPMSKGLYGQSDTWRFDVAVKTISHNVELDPKNFEIK
jgi:hypothetical protein